MKKVKTLFLVMMLTGCLLGSFVSSCGAVSARSHTDACSPEEDAQIRPIFGEKPDHIKPLF